MREIKFRALKDDMSNCNFVYGQLIYKIEPLSGNKYPAITTDGETYHSCLPKTEGQFTGLIDKNGNEIYEGDIVKQEWSTPYYGKYFQMSDSVNDHELIIQIVFHANRWMGIKKDGKYDNIISKGTLEVISNIHENPELLNN